MSGRKSTRDGRRRVLISVCGRMRPIVAAQSGRAATPRQLNFLRQFGETHPYLRRRRFDDSD
jgi:hypothetical protein